MKFCVIGLGRFGYQVATTLAENGMEVMGIDSNEFIIASIRDHITQGVCIQITDAVSLQSIGVEEMDTVIVAMGENFAQSILITALLKKRLNVPLVITRAINDIHKEILTLIGADRVILPEQEIGMKLADNLSLPFTVLSRVNKDFSICKITAPDHFIGQSITELQLFKKYNVSCISKMEDEDLIAISNEYIIEERDNLILAGKNKDLEKIAKL